MNLHDHMSKFETIRSNDFIVRMNKQEAAVFGDLVIELLTRARAELCAKYGIQLERPTVVELFDEQQDFAVRTFGIPGGDGFLGVCFGNVITANSPKAERPNNWKSTLWHEFCHVVTLNLTRNKMPRWLSEGISVYEELQKNPAWGQQMNPEYRRMILEGELTPISELSGAFLSPESPMHLQFAYYESSMVVEFLVKNYGYETLRAILADLAEGGQINDSISRRAAPLKEIEKQFDEFALKRAKSLATDIDWEPPDASLLNATSSEALAGLVKDKPNNFWLLTLYAKSLLAESKWQQAKEPLEKLIELYPEYTGADNAYMLLAQAYRNLDETDSEQDVLKKLAAISSDALYAYNRLMEIAFNNKNWQEVVDNGEKYLAVYPQLSSLHWYLGRAYEELGDNEKAIESYRRLMLLDPTDPAGVNYRIARLLEPTNPASAKRYVLTALAEAPRFRDAHRLLLKIVDEDMKTSDEQPAQQEGTP
jgi:tetratricopeptide (TPR) repeat protein